MVYFVATEITVVTVTTGTLILVNQVIKTSKVNFMLETTVFTRCGRKVMRLIFF